MSKMIVFCADGTWNGPGNADQTQDGCTPRLTNVCKLFGWLQGATDRPWGSPEMEKVLLDASGAPVQIAKYIHGVGDSQDVLDKVAGGAFGVGVVARIARGYTYVSRNYVPGDRISIVGFSRGAYTARALAGLILAEGLLRHDLATDVADKYDNAVAAWYRYRHGSDSTLVQRILDAIYEFHDIRDHFKAEQLTDDDFVPVPGLSAVAVWDTVGALGIPLYGTDGIRRDVFSFCDTRLNQNVGLGLHAVSLDEQRKTFEPTLWDDALNVTQALFPGGHCDVGGGYAEHSLSDVPLLWFVDRLQHPDVGLKFDADPPTAISPDACGCAHAEWAKPPWPILGAAPRSFRPGLMVHDAVRQRMHGGPVQPEPPPVPPAAYAPTNLPDPSA
jgi:uncharacterized protein (DUF2235 family)